MDLCVAQESASDYNNVANVITAQLPESIVRTIQIPNIINLELIMTIATAIHPENSTLCFKLNSSGTGAAQTIFMEGSPHMINVDAPLEVGGKDTSPSPISYVLSSLISSSQVTAQLVAKDFGVELSAFEFAVNANLDTAILIGGAEEGNPNIKDIVLNATIETDISDELFEKIRVETERRCPIYQLFSRSGANISNRWIRQAS